MVLTVHSANRTLVPIHCRVVKNLSEFDGAWTVCVLRSIFLCVDFSPL